MNTKLRKQLLQRKRKLAKRIDKSTGFGESRIRGGKVKYELSEKQQAVSCGGLGMILQMVSELKLRQHINRAAAVLKTYAPYDETDHILNIALNLLSGGTCLDHLEHHRPYCLSITHRAFQQFEDFFFDRDSTAARTTDPVVVNHLPLFTLFGTSSNRYTTQASDFMNGSPQLTCKQSSEKPPTTLVQFHHHSIDRSMIITKSLIP